LLKTADPGLNWQEGKGAMEAAVTGKPLSFKRLADGFGISVEDNKSADT
jgi:hypothetical protein